MAVILDHLTAILVGASLIGVMLFVQQRGAQSAVEDTVRYSAQTQNFSVMEMLERDMENMRSPEQMGYPANLQRAGDHTLIVQFHTLQSPVLGPSSPIIAVRYRLEDTHETRMLNGVATPVYRLARYVKESTDYTFTGASAESVTSFNVAFLTSNGAGVVTDGDAPVDFSHVRIELNSALEGVVQLAGDQLNTSRSNRTRGSSLVRPSALSVDGSTPLPPGIVVPDPSSDLPDSPYD